METLGTYNGATETHGFRVEVLRDPHAHHYIARISAFSPPVAAGLLPGQKMPTLKHYDLGEVVHEGIEGVIDLAKQRIVSHCGRILRFT